LEEIQRDRGNGFSGKFFVQEEKANKSLIQAQLKEENYWRFKPRISCLKAGDNNTKYFHTMVKARKVDIMHSFHLCTAAVIPREPAFKSHRKTFCSKPTAYDAFESQREISKNLYGHILTSNG
jgi:hypothetical protein